jgi:2-polyprenyl-6-methoxyphenol hydroxylase-like FAD-dependent oxidoreductase
MAEPQVLIVGAGPTGLALALWLARAGTPFRLIDRKSGPGEGSRAMVVQARTLEFYRQLGVADEVIAGGFRLDRLHLRNESREMAAVPLGDVGKGLGPYPFALSFPQDDHERLLVDRLRAAGHAVEWDTELTGITQQDGGVRADLRKPGGGEHWSGPYLCGCDGAPVWRGTRCTWCAPTATSALPAGHRTSRGCAPTWAGSASSGREVSIRARASSGRNVRGSAPGRGA